MAESIFVPSKFIVTKEAIRIRKEDSNELWSGLSNKNKSDVKYEDENSDCIVDGNALAVDTQKAIEHLVSKGLKIISITAVTSGQYEHRFESAFRGGGYGFSYTEGVMIVAI